MAGLFQGNPQVATSYVNTTSETPKWMQDAIYNQIQWATNIANRPYEEYQLPTVAGLSDLQQRAYSQVAANQGSWTDAMRKAQGSMYDAGNINTAGGLQTAQSQYTRPDLAMRGLEQGQQYYDRAGQMDVIGAAKPLLGKAEAVDIRGAGSPYLTQAGNINIQGAAAPYLTQAGQTTAQALADRALTAANPYLQAAAQSSAANIGQYMNPYQEGVMNVIAQQGARNLRENLLPSVSDAFIKAGQFGSSRMGEFGGRALRDTQEAILAQQAQGLERGYGQAISAAQADLARQAGLAGTVGSISGADLSRILSGGAQYGTLASTAAQTAAEQARNLANVGTASGALAGQQAQMYANLAQTTGNLTADQMRNLTTLGGAQTSAGQAQQTFGLSAAQAVQQAQAQDAARKLSAAQAMASAAQQGQQMGYADTAALEAAGKAQQDQRQRELEASYQEYMKQQLYPQQQLDWLNAQIRGMAPTVPQRTVQSGTTTGATYSPSPLQQAATAYYGGKALGI